MTERMQKHNVSAMQIQDNSVNQDANSQKKPAIIGLKINSRQLPAWLNRVIHNLVNRSLGFTQFNEFYAQLPEHEDHELSSTILDALNIKMELSGQAVNSYPRSGPLIFIANHPHGLVDGFALDHLIVSHRPDTHIMSVYLLTRLPEYRERLFAVDPTKKRRHKAMNVKAWRKSYKLVSSGGSFVVYPAGAVAHYQADKKKVTDPDWSPHIAALARRTGATVVPIFIHGGNSLLYRIAGMISPRLHNLLIFNELPKMRNRSLRITFGKQMPPEKWSHIADDTELIDHFRASVEALGQT